MGRFWTAVVLVLLMVLVPWTSAAAVDYPEYKGWVNDYEGEEGLMSQSEIDQLTTDISKLEQATSIEIAVVTIDSFGGQTAEEYASGIGDFWGVGKKDKNNGIVFLVSSKERHAYIRFASGIYSASNEAAAERILEDIKPDFKAGNYGLGIVRGVEALIEHLNPTPVATSQPNNQIDRISKSNDQTEQVSKPIDWTVVAIIGGGILLLILLVFVGMWFQNRRVKKLLIESDFRKYRKGIEKYSTLLNKTKGGLKKWGLEGLLKEIQDPSILDSDLQAINMVQQQIKLEEIQNKLEKFADETLKPAQRNLTDLASLIDGLENCQRRIEKLKSATGETETALKEIKAKYPNEDWKNAEYQLSLASGVDFLPEELVKVKQNMSRTTLELARVILNNFVGDRLIPMENRLNEINSMQEGVEEAYQKGPELMKRMEDLLSKAESERDIPDEVRQELESSRESFNSANSMLGGSNISWWLIYSLLISSMSHYDSAQNTREEIARHEEYVRHQREESSRNNDSFNNFSGFGGGGGFSSGGGAGSSW